MAAKLFASLLPSLSFFLFVSLFGRLDGGGGGGKSISKDNIVIFLNKNKRGRKQKAEIRKRTIKNGKSFFIHLFVDVVFFFGFRSFSIFNHFCLTFHPAGGGVFGGKVFVFSDAIARY